MKQKYFLKFLIFFLTLFSIWQVEAQTTFNYTGAIQTYTVPAGVTSINIDAIGASGGNAGTGVFPGGLGASMTGDFTVTAGEVLTILVGGQAASLTTGNGATGGGGGSFVVRGGSNPLIVAGGGAGRRNTGTAGSVPSADGSIGTSGQDAEGTVGTGGLDGYGGKSSEPAGGGTGGPGGGFLTNGGSSGTNGGSPGVAFLNGGAVAVTCSPFTSGTATDGGFGGGGAGAWCFRGTPGGGGGYSGGGSGSNNTAGGGGGSFNAGTNQINTAGANAGNGQVVITQLCDPITVTVTPGNNVCAGTMVTITGTSPNGTITWDNGITNDVAFTATTTTTYTSSSSDAKDCSETVTITVEDNEAPVYSAGLTVAPASIVANVPEANGYELVYELSIDDITSYAGGANYSVDNSAFVGSNHTRVAYYMELGGEYVWVSMDDFAAGSLSALAIPNATTNNVVWDQAVSNMNVSSNASSIVNGTGITTGNIEMWRFNYHAAGNNGIGGNNGTYDFDDTNAGDNSYGSFQVHNYGASQTLFALNQFNQGANKDLGIGNKPTGHPDWTFSDNSSAYDSKKLYILVNNTNTSLPDITAECSATPVAPTASDNCAGTVTGTTPTVFPITTQGTTIITWTYDDGNGNTSAQEQNVIIDDITAPVVSCIANTTRGTDPGVCQYTVVGTEFDATFTDNCMGGSISNDLNGTSTIDGEILPKGDTTVEWTVDDGNGQIATCITVITVEDNEAPTAIAQDITVQLDASGNAIITTAQINNGSTDNCDISSLSFEGEITAFAEVREGQNLTITLPAGKVVTSVAFASYGTPTGSNGDYTQGTCHAADSQRIVEDYALGENSFTIPATNGKFGDPCGGTVKRLYVAVNYLSEATEKTFTCDEVGANTVNLIVTDANGNFSTANAVVTVEDNIAPTAIAQDITVELDANGNANITPEMIDNGSSDLCGDVTLRLDKTGFSCENTGGTALDFVSANNSYFATNATAAIPIGAQERTISLWVNPDVSQFCWGCLVQQGEGDCSGKMFGLGMTELNKLIFWGGCDDYISDLSIPNNTWTYVAITLKNGLVTLYANDQVESFTKPGLNTLASKLFVGRETTNNGASFRANFDGQLDEIRIYDKALSALEIEEERFSTNPTNGIITRYSFEKSAGTPAADTEGNNNGTLYGFSDENFVEGVLKGIEVTLTVTDKSGNISTETAIVTVVDNVAPVATTQNITVQLDAAGNATIAEDAVNDGSTDACDGLIYETDITGFDCSNVGPNDVVLTVTDVNGNFSTANAVVTVEDNVAAIAIAKDITVQLDETGNVSITAEDVDNGSNDACGIASMSVSPDIFTCAEVGGNTVTLTVTDNNGNVAITTSTVTVVDNNAPVITQPEDLVLNTDPQECSYTFEVPLTVEVTDNCAIENITGVRSDGLSLSDPFPLGETIIEWTATDENENVSSGAGEYVKQALSSPADFSGDETLIDFEEYTFGTLINDQYSNEGVIFRLVNGQSPSVYEFPNPRSFDPQGTFGLINTSDPNGNQAAIDELELIFPAGINRVAFEILTNDEDDVTFTVICMRNGDVCHTQFIDTNINFQFIGFESVEPFDKIIFRPTTTVNGAILIDNLRFEGGSNTEPIVQKITVLDKQPAVAIAKDITVQLDETGNVSITAADVDNGSNDACGISSMSVAPSAFTCAEVGGNTVTLTVIDNNGNESTTTSIVTVEDNVAAIALSKDITVQLDETGTVSITAADVDNGSNDSCGIASMSVSPSAFTCAEVGGNTVTLTVTDNNGNVAITTSTVTVEDNVAAIASAKDITVQLDETGTISITAEDVDNGSNDACGIASMSVSPSEFTCAEVGANTVTLTVTDNNGNVAITTSTVTVEDNVAAIASAKDITVQLDETGNVSITAEDVDNGSNDACGIASMSVSPDIFTCAEVGGNTVTLTVTDNNGNAATTTSIITVEDNVAAIAIAKDITVQLDETGNVLITAADVDDGSNDACGIASMSVSPSELTCAEVGGNTVTLTVIDNNGNESTTTSTVTVEDNVAPVAISKDITVQLDETGNVSITAADVDNGSNDACGIASMSVSPDSFTCAEVGGNTVTLTVTDNNGNVATTTAIVTVEDSIKPIPSATSLPEITAICEVLEAAVTLPTAIDNCAGVVSVSHDVSFPITTQGLTVITWSFEDVNGNIATQTQDVVIEDTTPPVPDVTTLEDIIVECEAIIIEAPTATDNCGGSITGTTLDPLSYSEEGEFMILWEFNDGNGNIAPQEQWVTVKDNTAPEINTQDLTITVDQDEPAVITPEEVNDGSTDNCSDIVFTLDRDSFDKPGVYEVVLSGTDASGNTSQAPATIKVKRVGADPMEVHVVPTMLTRTSIAKVILPFRGRIMEVQVLEVETNNYKVFDGNKKNVMEIDIAPMKGTLLVKILDNEGNFHLTKLIAL
jgi:uncharacterized protein YrzB (UPF0473 family)